MSNYIDGFVLPIATDKVAAYRRLARKASRIWLEHGALEYVECSGDDLAVKNMVPFLKLARAKPGETVILAWAVFESRRARDRANVAIMNDPRIGKLAATCGKLFDCSRMAYGGFKVIVQLRPKMNPQDSPTNTGCSSAAGKSESVPSATFAARWSRSRRRLNRES